MGRLSVCQQLTFIKKPKFFNAYGSVHYMHVWQGMVSKRHACMGWLSRQILGSKRLQG